MSHTYGILKVSSSTYAEIKSALEAAGYSDQFNPDSEHGIVIDMQGIALAEIKIDVENYNCSVCGIHRKVATGECASRGGTTNFYVCAPCARKMAEAAEG